MLHQEKMQYLASRSFAIVGMALGNKMKTALLPLETVSSHSWKSGLWV